MAKVHIVQCLCPQRHCILAIAVEESDEFTAEGAEAELRKLVKGLVRDKQIDPWCGICHSQTLVYESRPSRFNSMEEAIPHLQEQQMKQILSRMTLDRQNRN